MPDLYRTLQRDQPEVRFHYLSNTREHSRAESLVKRFLRTNGFPAGELDLRNGLSRKEFKQDIIRALILEHRPEDVICIGNNAGQDVRVFQEMTEELGLRVRFHVFIHRISFCPPGSDQNPQLGQIGYVTPIELAMSLENQGLLRKKSVTRLARKLISRPPEASRLKRALAERCSGPAPRSER